MNVLHVIPAVAPRYGGPSVAVIEMCRALERRGTATLIATTDADGAGRLDVPLGVPTLYGGVKTMFFRRVASEAYKYSPALAAWLSRHVRTFDMVHVHAVMSHACVAAARACRASGVPFVLRTIGTLDEWSLGQKPLRKRLFMNIYGNQMLAGAQAIHATAPGEIDALRRSFDLKHVALVPLGVDDGWLDAPLSPAPGVPPYLLAMSRLHPVKALDRLIPAFARATASPASAHWRLVIAGDGDAAYVQTLRALAQGTAAAGRIEFTGWSDGAAKADLLRHASAFALPSFHENFGLAALEAMACGVPTIVGEGVQLASWIRDADAGWIAAPGIDALAAALTDVMSDPIERTRRGEGGRRLASRMRWSSVAGELADVYEQVRARASEAPGAEPPVARAAARAE